MSGFVPGARVLISDHYDCREARVDKVHKSGRFTLVGSAQQWKPYQNGSEWHATKTGSDQWVRQTARLWNDAADAKLSAMLAISKRKDRWAALRRQFEQLPLKLLTDEMLNAIEDALPPKETP